MKRALAVLLFAFSAQMGLVAFADQAQNLFVISYFRPGDDDYTENDGVVITPENATARSGSPAVFHANPKPGEMVQYWIVADNAFDVDNDRGERFDYGSSTLTWTLNRAFGNKANLQVGARFCYITNSVAFNAGASGVSGSTAGTGWQCYTNSYALTPNGFSRTGYTFANWTNDAGRAYANKAMVSGSSLGVTNNMQVVNLYAVWTANVYTVTFNANGGSTPTPSKSVTYDSTYGTLPSPTWTGHTFDGWYTDSTGGSRRYEGTKVSITSDETLYAHWKVVTHRLTTAVSGSGGSVSPATRSYDYGTVVDVTATPSTGWLFKGWQEDSLAVNPRTVTLVSDVTLTAVFTQKVYAVTFKYRNSSGQFVSAEPQYVNHGGNATAPSQELYDSYPGHVFSNWNASYENVTSTITVVAEYAANNYTVEYNPNCDAYTGTMDSQTKPCGDTWPLRKNKFARAGYTFGGWNTNQDGSGNSYEDEENVSDLSLSDGAIVTLYAQWTPITYSIEFNGGTGSSGSMNTMSGIAYGAEVVLSANEFTKPGCEFQGWKCSELFFENGATVSNLTTTAGATVTLVAMWDAPYWIAFDANGGAGEMAVQRFEADEAKALSSNEFTRTGYTFEGWATNAAEAAALVVRYADRAVVSNLVSETGATNTLFAAWRPISYVTAFDASKHSSVAIAPYNCIYDVEFSLPTVPCHDGDLWQFVGWSNTLENVVYYTNEVSSVSNLCTTAGATNTLVAVWKSLAGELSEAMDIYDLVWENVEDENLDESWKVVSDVGYGTDSCVAQTGLQSAKRFWEMSTSVTNSGTLTFWWKTDEGRASLNYYSTQGPSPSEVETNYTGSTEWTKLSLRVEVLTGSGYASERQVYLCPASGNTSPADTIYIDRMTWTPDGSSVEPTPADARDISGISFDGGVLSLSFTNADERFSYNLRGTNDLVAPLALWPVLWTTNGTGNITITPQLVPSAPQFFYYLETTAK